MNTIDRLRSYRIGQFAIFDFAGTAILAAGAAHLLRNKIKQERIYWLAIPFGIAVHSLVGRKTPLNKMILGQNANILAQIAIITMIVMGCRPS